MTFFWQHYPKAALQDFELVKRISKGDSQAFTILVEKYEKKVRALGYSFFKNDTDSADFVQDVFLKVYTNISTFRKESQFSTWLMRIAYNTAVNAKNRRKEYVTLSEHAEILDNDYSVEEKQLRELTAEAIREALKELPKQFALCLDLYFFYDFSHSEISVITGLPVNTIKSNIFRAKKQLKQKLEDFISDEA